MKLSKLLKNCPEQFAETEILNVTDDSRKVEKGSLFVCVKGPVSDGHNYAKQAIDNGAVVVVCEHVRAAAGIDIQHIVNTVNIHCSVAEARPTVFVKVELVVKEDFRSVQNIEINISDIRVVCIRIRNRSVIIGKGCHLS